MVFHFCDQTPEFLWQGFSCSDGRNYGSGYAATLQADGCSSCCNRAYQHTQHYCPVGKKTIVKNSDNKF